MKISIPGYCGQNKAVIDLIDFLEKNLRQYLVGAYLHGSVGSGEEIPYSDLDALAIIKNVVCQDPLVLKKAMKALLNSEKYFYQFDPLQHHGWFILHESDLQAYPEHYLPSAVLNHGQSLFSDQGLDLEIEPIFSKELISKNFENMAAGIRNKLSAGSQPRNLYQQKGLFSQFMLLPALYVQVKEGRGIYKKFSFDLARRDFSDQDWSIMDEISMIRSNWKYSLNRLQKILLTRNWKIRSYCAKFMPIAIPMDIKSKLTGDFYKRMNDLIVAMKAKLS
jgi:hypothetical protein